MAEKRNRLYDEAITRGRAMIQGIWLMVRAVEKRTKRK